MHYIILTLTLANQHAKKYHSFHASTATFRSSLRGLGLKPCVIPGVGIAGAAATLWEIGGHPEVVQGKEYIRGSQSGRHETTY